MRSSFRSITLACALCASLGFATASQATPITYSTSQGEFTPGTNNQGWWSDSATAFDTNDNYIVGELDSGEYRNFFTFDLTSLMGPVTSATLQIQTTTDCAMPGGSLTYGLFDVSTAAATLNNNNGINASIFNDLGTGTSYGQTTISSCSDSVLNISLNAAALADINAAQGGYFSIGGALLNLSGGADQYMLGNSGGIVQNLVLDATASVPEPGSLGLFGLGLAGLGLAFLNRRRRVRA